MSERPHENGSRRAQQAVAPQLQTFLIADVRGYTRFSAEHGDEGAARLAERFAALCEEVLELHGGRVIELRGDEALCVFSSSRDALRGAVALQGAFLRSVLDDPTLPLNVGMGLDAGEAIPVRGGYRGGALNLAARLCSIAGGGEVLASETVIGLARKTEGLSFIDRGQVILKGLTSPVRVLQIAPEGELPDELPPLQPILVTHPTNLPDDPTPFIGREEEIVRITRLLRDPGARLVTLTGPGGTGKSRLALQAGNTVLHDFKDGVFYVSLGLLTDPNLVTATIAEVLAVQEAAGKDHFDSLAEHLKTKQLLLVLDNFEHLLDAAHVVSSLLDGCRELHILVTSRIPLRLRREHEHAVPPFGLPDLSNLPDLDTLSQYESLAFFTERARAARSTFALTEENARAIAEICHRLDGLPLAIELAAARIKLFPPGALLERLSKGLQLLTGGARDLPERQRTLRGAIDWSYSLLDEEEQKLFACLSVFAGGCTFEAVEAVCNPLGDSDPIDGIGSLVEKSLLRQVGEEEPRFSMLQTIREYASERLEEWGEGEAARGRHADYFLALAGEAERELVGPSQGTWLQRLEFEHDNIRAATGWLQKVGRVEDAARIAGDIWIFWWNFGHIGEGRQRLEDVLSRTGLTDRNRARALRGAGHLASMQGDFEHAHRHFDESISLCRRTGDMGELVRTLTWAVDLPLLFEERYDLAAAILDEATPLARQVGDDWALTMCTANLGIVAAARGAGEEAIALFTEALSGLRRLGDTTRVAWLTYTLGNIELEEGRISEAREAFRETLSIVRDVGHVQGMVETICGLACVAAGMGRDERAATLWGASDSLRETYGLTSQAGTGTPQGVIDHWTSLVQNRLGSAAWQEAWSRGSTMPLAEAVEYALSDDVYIG